ncbi:type VII secretion protein EccCa [Nocardioides jishulii]|uniref:Type VII secretion protein EccCa n=1 Tax=Nocardioides jishulii TaxID=2575440 RepID=A0A4U2YTB8_9ACTN|nr:type VII secretion protein EccCa [Nocardioides jishulii]QCX28849.1 type VII secretion protein EccCa [Nocardioides jishulii]TKI64254.1 type VII secretion protein EccCa [Nocardioides jishulii]
MPTPMTGPTTVPAPPTLPLPEGSSTLVTGALPMLAGFGSMVMMAGMTGVGQARVLVAGGFFLLSTSVLLGSQMVRQRRQHQQRIEDLRRTFLRDLARARGEIDARASERRTRLDTALPPLPSRLGDIAGAASRTLQSIRIGVARLGPEHTPELLPPEDPDRADPVAVRAVEALTSQARLSQELPLGLDWAQWDRVTAQGEEAQRVDLVRLLVCQSAVAHHPSTLRIVLVARPEDLYRWDWLKWLPHHRSASEHDAVAGRRLVLARLDDLPADERHHTLVVVDGVAAPVVPSRTSLLQVDVHHTEVGARESVVRLDGASAVWETSDSTTHFSPDACSHALAETVARRVDGAHQTARSVEHAALDDLPALVGVPEIDRWTPEETWSGPAAQLAVPIGLDEEHRPVVLDLKESAHGGDGPHGLVVGATGSGKSELLRTLVLGLAMTHAPLDLAMVLVDFKGGATFAGLSRLPHVSALVTNLGDDLSLVDRMADTLTGELVRRQEVLRAHGHSSLVEHREARASDPSLEPMPSLFVCIDEFSELLSARPEFIDVFVAIGRVGRSLGVHLLLASQRIEEGRLRGLETHLSYRIGLRTFSAAESRAALGVPDAFSLPSSPGAGYLSTGTGGLRRFSAAYVSGPPTQRRVIAPFRRPLPWTLLPLPRPVAPIPRADATTGPAGVSTVDVVVDRVAHLPRTRPIWLPPLEHSAALGELLTDVRSDPALGLHSPRIRAAAGRQVAVGVVDRPREQRRDVWSLDLSGATGHCAVIGGPRSGRTTALRTIVTGLALGATPTELQLFLLDFGGGGLAPLAGLPHVAGHASRGEELLSRLAQEVRDLVDRREALFRDHGLDGFDAYVRARAAGRVDDGYGEIFVVVDGWGTLRSDDHDLEAALHRVAERALTFGVHLVVATQRWGDLRPAVRDLFGSQVELRLGDPAESTVHRARAATVPAGVPGRGLVTGGLHLLTARPALDATSDVTDLVAAIDRHWSGTRPPRITRLPESVDLDGLLADVDVPADTILLGASSADVPVGLDLGVDLHLVVRGAHGSGRSSTLRTYLHEVTRARPPSHLQVVLVDPRGSLDGVVEHEHLLHHLVSRQQTSAALAELASYLEGRLPTPDVGVEALRSRSWWSGAEVVVVVDDHDLVTAGGWQQSGLQRLTSLLPQARDVGLRVVVAQRTGRGARSHDPFVQALHDLDVAVLDLTADDSTGSRTPPGRARLTTRRRVPRALHVAQVRVPSPAVGVHGGPP